MNYYELFNIAPSAVVDRTYVAKTYFELQKQYHPDFFTNENEADKEAALAKSAEVNNAYQIFKQKDKTLEYFLLQKKLITADEKHSLPTDFLMEMMELNEDIIDEEATKNKMIAYEQSLHNQVAPLLQAQHIAEYTDEELQLLKLYYYKKKYLQRILERLGE